MWKFMFSLACWLLLTVSQAVEVAEYTPGNMDLVITIPHGGSHLPAGWPDRQNGCLNTNGECFYDSGSTCTRSSECPARTVKDSRTMEVGELAAKEIERVLGTRPHLVKLNVHRKKLDANREVGEAAQGYGEAIAAYNKYHGYIEQAINSFQKRGLVLDIHGQVHSHESTELGYLLYKSRLLTAADGGDDALDQYSSVSSIYGLNKQLEGCKSLKDLVMGQDSLGRYLEDEGYLTIPSPKRPTSSDDSFGYFSGGYTTKTYRSQNGLDSKSDSIQIEAPAALRYKAGASVREAFALGLGKAIANFYTNVYSSQCS